MQQKTGHILALGALLGASSALAALKYEPDSYVQDGLVVFLDGIRNVGAGLPHNPNAPVWANLADANNPARIKKSNSSGWRNGTGYYFNYDGGVSHAQLDYGTPAMTQATFEFVFEGSWDAQTARNWGPMFISGANNHSICIGSAASPLFFRQTSDWVGTTSDDYCRIAGWGWKQASFTIGEVGDSGRKGYDQGRLIDAKPRATANEGCIPVTAWMVGSRQDQIDAGRQLTGVMKSVRIYNRALTADEVLTNAVIDAARFDGVMPVTNAVVATAVAGAFGNEVPGVYAVDGSHTFAAQPSVTVGSTTYVCTGYTLETWENGAWSSPVAVAGFAATVSESEKVRITWLWEAATGALGADIDAYSTDSIKVWYDGIHNIGKAMPHADDGVWRELVSNSPANMTTNANSHWTSDGYYFAAGPSNERSYVYLRQLVSLGTVGTIEIACDTKASDQTATWAKYLTFGYTNTGWSASYENAMCLQVNAKQTFLRLVDDAWTGNSEAGYAGTEYANWNFRANTSSPWDGKHAAFVVDTAGHRTYLKGARDVVKPCRKVVKEMPPAFWMIGNTYYNGTVAADQLVGTMKAVRAYGRVLSDEEISRHYSIDVWRFDGTLPVSNAVEVAADVRGLAGREAAGVYFPLGWTFSSGTSAVAVGDKTYEPCGYIVEVWDTALETWRVAESSDGATTWTSPAAAPFASRRLTWKWRMVNGIRSAADYDVGDYVQGGLVGWLDGIRNVGIDQPHDGAAMTWADLSGRASSVTLATNDVSHWTDDGYYFNIGSDGKTASYAYLKPQLSLGTVGTIEVATDVKYYEQNPNKVSGDFVSRIVAYSTGVYGGEFWDSCVRVQSYTQNNLNWNADHWADTNWENRVNIPAPWDGRHAAFVMDAESYSSYARGVLSQTKTRGSVVTMPKLWWMVGNKYNYSSVLNQLTGTVKALRLYNRPLSAAEIAHNYKVDVARFDGALTVTNVVVAGKFSDYEGVARGAYEVEGSYTFTAGAATDKDGKVLPLLGYTVEAWDGSAWGEAERHSGSSYTYTAGTDPAKVRLTWKWDGMMVILR
ncbi:MAG: hypothetical protein IKE55_04985 [Kiritimatiellae bacterium]|nr:hypothetical protein [Kiritimatiellia bacterium]